MATVFPDFSGAEDGRADSFARPASLPPALPRPCLISAVCHVRAWLQLPCALTKLSCVCLTTPPPPHSTRQDGRKNAQLLRGSETRPRSRPTACVRRGAGRHRIAMSLPYRLRLRQSRCRNLAICSHGGRVLVGDNGCEGRSAPAGVTDSHRRLGRRGHNTSSREFVVRPWTESARNGRPST